MNRRIEFERKDLEEARVLKDQYWKTSQKGKYHNSFKHLKAGTVTALRLRHSTIATLAKFLYEKDKVIYPKSTILRVFLEAIASDINREHTEYSFVSESEAINYLEQLGILNESTSRRTSKSITDSRKIDILVGNMQNKDDFDPLELERIAIKIQIKRGETPDPEVLKRLEMSNSKEQTTDPKEIAKLMALSSPTIVASKACETIQETIKEGENND